MNLIRYSFGLLICNYKSKFLPFFCIETSNSKKNVFLRDLISSYMFLSIFKWIDKLLIWNFLSTFKNQKYHLYDRGNSNVLKEAKKTEMNRRKIQFCEIKYIIWHNYIFNHSLNTEFTKLTNFNKLKFICYRCITTILWIHMTFLEFW